MDHKTMFLVIFAIIGLFLLKESITGFSVISQTCCFPAEGCDEENLCPVASEMEAMSPANYYVGIAGSSLIVILSLFLIYYTNRS